MLFFSDLNISRNIPTVSTKIGAQFLEGILSFGSHLSVRISQFNFISIIFVDPNYEGKGLTFENLSSCDDSQVEEELEQVCLLEGTTDNYGAAGSQQADDIL